nr:HigA family addiction module antitoxin [Rhodoferax sp.]
MTSQTKRAATSFGSLADFAPDWIATPGDTIADLLGERGWTQVELAQRTGFTTKHINLLLKGDAPITQDTAIKLEKVLGSTARFWLGLEAQYREQLARKADVAALAADVGWLKELPLAEMVKFGWVARVQDKALQVHECLRYFAVSGVAAWRLQYQQPVAAYRASPRLTRAPAAVATWLRQGERLAANRRCEDYDKTKFESVLAQVRALTREREPKKFLPELQRLCAQAGVAVVLAPAPTGCPVSGATKWLGTNKALIILSVRGKSDDKLWFTFFHEAGHLLKHGKSLTFLDTLGEDGLNPEEEAEADAFARDFLLPQQAYKNFVTHERLGAPAVRAFAQAQGVAPGIVVGRLQFDKHLPWAQLNELKVKYVWGHEKSE